MTTTEAENLAQRLHNSHGGQSCAAIDMIREQAAEIARLKAEAELLARHIGLNMERKNALLRDALRAFRYHIDQTRPISVTIEMMDAIEWELK